jgi:hypothetical protein
MYDMFVACSRHTILSFTHIILDMILSGIICLNWVWAYCKTIRVPDNLRMVYYFSLTMLMAVIVGWVISDSRWSTIIMVDCLYHTVLKLHTYYISYDNSWCVECKPSMNILQVLMCSTYNLHMMYDQLVPMYLFHQR